MTAGGASIVKALAKVHLTRHHAHRVPKALVVKLRECETLYGNHCLGMSNQEVLKFCLSGFLNQTHQVHSRVHLTKFQIAQSIEMLPY